MKKNLLFFAAAAGMLALASCSQDATEGVDNGSAIKFRPSINGITRAVPTTVANLSSFNVTGFVEGASTNYFTNWQVNKNGSVWETVGNQYWPSTGALKFFAYAPTSGVGTVSITPSAQTINGFTVETQAANQKDLVVAYNAGTKAANEKTGIALNFKHALTQIEIHAKNAKPSEFQVEVLGVKLGYFNSQADFIFPVSVLPGTLPSQSWKTPTMVKSCFSDLDAAVTLTNTAQNITKSNFMVIPQKLTPWSKTASKDGAYLSVLVRIYKKNGSDLVQLYPKTAGKYAYTAIPLDSQLLPGKKYTFVLNFLKNGAGNIDPDPTNPDNPDPVDPTPGPGGDDVLGGAIKFTVTVDDWVNETPINKDL